MKLWKKVFVVTVSVVLLSCLVVLNFGSQAAAADQKVYKFRMQVLFGPSQLVQYQPFVDYVDKASGGRIKIDLYAGGQLVPTDQMLSACAEGTIDLAGGAGGYWSNLIPLANVEAGMPFALRTLTDVNTFFYQKGFLELCRKAYAEHGIYYLGPQMVDFAFIQAKKPVKTLDDLKKLKFRAVPNTSKLLGKSGISAVYIPAEEVYMAISTGTLDGVIYGGAMSNSTMSYQEVAPYYMVPPINIANQNLIMGMKQWNSLPKDLQAVLDLATQYENLYIQTLNWDLEFLSRVKMIKENNLKIVQMDDSLINTLTDSAKEFWAEVGKKDAYSKQGIDMLMNYIKEVGYIK
ncbi:MAG: TRAP transporter substrate-binding protein DctP [Deltaproteobacteria bacterium]|nr:TRAP transporter substrate-binding protein DctP [Deltaproteobacteria bacterium]